MTIGISVFVGVCIGIGIITYANCRVEKQAKVYRQKMQKLETEIEDLQTELRHKFVQEAYAAGVEEGRKNPYDEAEKFARNFAGKNIKFALNDRNAM